MSKKKGVTSQSILLDCSKQSKGISQATSKMNTTIATASHSLEGRFYKDKLDTEY